MGPPVEATEVAQLTVMRLSESSTDVGTTLGDHFTLQRGTTYSSSLLDRDGPVLLGLASIHRNGGFRTDALRTYGGECPEKLLVHPGELYVSLKDVTQSADLLGSVAMLPVGHASGRLTQDTVKLEPKRNGIGSTTSTGSYERPSIVPTAAHTRPVLPTSDYHERISSPIRYRR